MGRGRVRRPTKTNKLEEGIREFFGQLAWLSVESRAHRQTYHYLLARGILKELCLT